MKDRVAERIRVMQENLGISEDQLKRGRITRPQMTARQKDVSKRMEELRKEHRKWGR